MKRLVFILSIIFLLTCLNSLSADTLEIATTDSPPLTSQNSFENLGNGIFVDITSAIIEKSGNQADFKFLPPRRAYATFLGKKIPYILSSKHTVQALKIDENQLNILSLGFYSQYFFYFKSHIGKDVVFKKYEDLSGYSVCVTAGSFIVPVLKKANVHVEEASSNETCAKKLEAKRNDLWGALELTANFYTKKLFPDKLSDLSHTNPSSNSTDEVYFISFKSDTKASTLHEQLIPAFQQLKQDGTALKIMQKYWGDNVPEKVLPLDMRK